MYRYNDWDTVTWVTTNFVCYVIISESYVLGRVKSPKKALFAELNTALP